MSDFVHVDLLGSSLVNFFPDCLFASGHTMDLPFNLSVHDAFIASGIKSDIRYWMEYDSMFCRIGFADQKKSFLFFKRVAIPPALASVFIRKLASPVCPRCGSVLRLASGPYGLFLSCHSCNDFKKPLKRIPLPASLKVGAENV